MQFFSNNTKNQIYRTNLNEIIFKISRQCSYVYVEFAANRQFQHIHTHDVSNAHNTNHRTDILWWYVNSLFTAGSCSYQTGTRTHVNELFFLLLFTLSLSLPLTKIHINKRKHLHTTHIIIKETTQNFCCF